MDSTALDAQTTTPDHHPSGLAPARLSEAQRASFERDGFLVVPNALPYDKLQNLLEVTDRLIAQNHSGFNDKGLWALRNCFLADAAFMDLLDWPTTFPLIADLLGWDIQMVTSHLVVRAPNPPGTPESALTEGWHRDYGRISHQLPDPQPRVCIKVAYWFTDVSESGRGNIRVLPGSNRLNGRPAFPDGEPHPYGALEIRANPGDALLFEQRTWHAVGPNRSEMTRKGVFMGYAYRWLRPMDYTTQPPEVLARVSPIRRQLLGHAETSLGYVLPQDADVPLRAWMNGRSGE